MQGEDNGQQQTQLAALVDELRRENTHLKQARTEQDTS